MARVNPPGVTEVWWGTTATLAAPTTAELNAFTDITGFVSGVPSVPESFNTADTSNLSSKRNSNIPASYGGDTGTITVYLDDTTDTAYETLTVGTSGYLAIPWLGLATAGTFAVSDDVWLYPVKIGTRPIDVVGRDDVIVSSIEFTITDDPTEKYSLAT